MAEPFDPYYKWLGIGPQDQPPNHYRLLGLAAFEADPEVIDAAANRVTAYIQGCAQGSHAAHGQKILSEVSAARLCLLDERQKARYDAKLQQQQTKANPTRVQRHTKSAAAPREESPAEDSPPEESPLALNLTDTSAPAKPSKPAKPGNRGKRTAQARSWKQYVFWLAPAAVILVGAASYIFTRPKPERVVIRQYQRPPAFNSAEDAQAAHEPVSLNSLPGTVLDNNQAETQGIWPPQQAPGSKYVGLYFLLAKSGDNVAKFKVPANVVGSFEVRMSYVPAGDRATNVKVQVFAAGGKGVSVAVNQRQAPKIDGLFHSLGTFTFQGGNDERIEISAQGADGTVVVDAIQFLPASSGKQ